MKEIINNKDNLKEEDMTEVIKRVKVLLLNSKNELLLGYSNNDYQFPGGHVEESEEFIETIKREIMEETGINLKIESIEPFACCFGYYKDHPEEGENRKTEIFYYEIKTDENPNLENTTYTEREKEGNFELRYIHLDNVEEELKNNKYETGEIRGIAKEMLKVIEVYKESKINEKNNSN